jgi:hypothetical protein
MTFTSSEVENCVVIFYAYAPGYLQRVLFNHCHKMSAMILPGDKICQWLLDRLIRSKLAFLQQCILV